MKSFIVLLSSCFFVLLLFASPAWVRADCPEGYCSYDGFCFGEGGKVKIDDVVCTCRNGSWDCPAEGIYNPVIGIFGRQAGELTIAYILATLLRLSLVAAGILLLIYLIFSGIQWLTSGGEKTAVAAARDKITNAFIGLIIIVFVIVIINLINYIFGLDILHPTLPTPE